MIDRGRLHRLTMIATAACAVGAGTAAVGWNRAAAGGVILGGALAVVPFLSWAYIAAWLEGSPKRKALAALLLIGKMGLYSAALYVFVTRPVVHPAGVMAGLTLVIFTYLTGALVAPKPAEVQP
jgi:hypothetical protein